MKDIQTIMVALASSEHAEGLFAYATNLAEKLGANLIVANVINSRDVEAVETIVSMGYEVDGEHYVESIKKERREIMEQIISPSPFPKERLRTILKVGNPIDELLKIMSQEKVDMVVMGPKGRTDLRHVLVGSVAEKMFRRSPVTIVSYRDEAYAARLKKRLFK